MTWLATVRFATFVTANVFAIIVMGVSAGLISLTEPAFYYKFAALALATSLLTLFTTIPMFVIDSLRQGSFLSWIATELGWLTVLWILWLSSASYAAWTDGQIDGFFSEESSCNFGVFGDDDISSGCHEIKAIMAFAFLTWILLMAYTTLLLVLSIRATSRGHNVWKSSVRDGVLLYAETKNVGSPAQVSVVPVSAQTYPPQQAAVPQQYPASLGPMQGTHGAVQV